jgi:endonuclease/exonuclease/phosphatase family metal-dependent hydrolase
MNPKTPGYIKLKIKALKNKMKLKIVTYNLFLSTPTAVRRNSQDKRSKLLGEKLLDLGEKKNIDVWCFQELIQDRWYKNVISQLKNKYPYVTEKVASPWYKLKPITGGLYIVSRYPISHQNMHVYRGGASWDIEGLVSKGVVWARVITPDGPVNVINTHLQAWNTKEAVSIRKKQVLELKSFIRGNVGAVEHSVVCGDFNFDLYTQQQQIIWIENQLGAKVVHLNSESAKFSSDPHRNQLVGNDSSSQYKTEFYPNGCYNIYENTLSCPCCPQELLDLFFIYSAEVVSCHVLSDVRSTESFLAKLNFSTERYLVDLSDHYPVLLSLKFDQILPAVPRPTTTKNKHKSTWLLLVVVIILLLSYGLSG